MYNFKISLLVIFTSLFISSCENLFEYSPYSATVDDNKKNNTLNNINKLKLLSSSDKDKEYVRVAVFSDIHNYYSRLDKVIDDINKDYSIDFIIIPGDLTDLGSLKEYEFALESLNKLVMPYFTVIGNHDYRSNGKKIYNEMFGVNNYIFDYSTYRFIFFDDIVWESDKLPDFSWLKSQLSDTTIKQKILVTHIPPSSNYIEYQEGSFTRIIEQNTDLVIDGHTHKYSLDTLGGIPYLTSCSINRDSYEVVTFRNGTISIEKKEF